MRIATITNWAYGVTVVLTLVSGGTMLLASRADELERAAVEERARFDELTSTIKEDAYRLTEQARLYSINGNPSHLIVYRHDSAALGSIEQRLARLRDVGARTVELDALRNGLRWVDSLRDEQQAAIDDVAAGKRDEARAIMFGAEYERDLDRAATSIERFQFLLDQRTEAAVSDATRATREARFTSQVMLAITALMVLFVLYFVIKHRILRPVVRLSDVINRLASQDFAVEPPDYRQIDEIGDMAQAIRVFRENGLERQRLERERSADQEIRELLARMTQRLQGCGSVADLGEVVRLFAPQIAPELAGRIYIHDDASQEMVELASWQAPRHSSAAFPPDKCWALRRGQTHRPVGGKVDVPCAHLEAGVFDTICIPLTAQGETIGLLYFEERDGAVGTHMVADVYLELLAENIGLALANLRLRDKLREMALVDPLTGLSNRHQLDSVLKLQAGHAARNKEPLSCVMLDVDHFKRFNDAFGHEAGDAVLRHVGDILSNATREDGVAFRYGGEEFLLLMPGHDVEQARERCESIRRDIQALQVKFEGETLGPVTSSFGVATYRDELAPGSMVRNADAALLRAKQEGRNRVVVAG